MKKGEFLAVFQILILFVAIIAFTDLVAGKVAIEAIEKDGEKRK